MKVLAKPHKLLRAIATLVMLAVTLAGYNRPVPAARAGATSADLISPIPPQSSSGQSISQEEWDQARSEVTGGSASKSGEGTVGIQGNIAGANWNYLPSLGVNMWGTKLPSTAIGHLNDMGIKLVRYDLSWWRVLVNSGDPNSAYNWSQVDANLQALAKNGIYAQIVITGCPGWACNYRTPTQDPGGGLDANGPIQAYFDKFENFYRTAMDRYADRSFWDPAIGSYRPYLAYAWELFNEPDFSWPYAVSGYQCLPQYNCPPGPGRPITYVENYMGNLVGFWYYLKNRCSKCIVMNGGLAFTRNEAGDDFLTGTPTYPEGALYWGITLYSDALNFHFYHGDQYPGDARWRTIQQVAQRASNLIHTRDAALPLVVNEAGISSLYGGFDQHKQSRYLLYNQVQAMSTRIDQGTSMHPIKSLNIFMYQDDPNLRDFETHGLVTSAYAPKWAYYAVDRYNLEIGPQPYLGALSLTSCTDLEGYKFQSDRVVGVTTWLLWRNNDTACLASIPDPNYKIRTAADMYGNPFTPTRSGSNIQVTVGRDPLYLRWNP